MKLPWFKNKTSHYPEFWNRYLDYFKEGKQEDINHTRFIALDTETTGFNIKEDRVLSIGAVAFMDKKIQVKESLELYIEQDIFKPETVEIHGLMKKGDLKKISELEAIKQFLAYVKNDVLIAHHANFDKNMINEMLIRHGLDELKNEFIDTGFLYKKAKHIIYQETLKPISLDDLAKELNVPIVDRHTATGDALITGLVFLKILARLDKRKQLKWNYLLNKESS